MLQTCTNFILVLVFFVNVGSPHCLTVMHRHNWNEGRPRGLRLSGRIVEGEITDDGSDNVKVALKLRLEIKNVGSKNALILKRDPVVVERTIIATPSDAGTDKHLFWLQTLPSIARNREWEGLQKHIDQSTPLPDLIRELAPNETWALETDTWFYISKTANIDPNSKSWPVIRQASPVWLQVALQMWSGDIELFVNREKLTFSKTLQRRWQKFGDLQLENLTSEPIPLDFSSFAVSSTKH